MKNLRTMAGECICEELADARRDGYKVKAFEICLNRHRNLMRVDVHGDGWAQGRQLSIGRVIESAEWNEVADQMRDWPKVRYVGADL